MSHSHNFTKTSAVTSVITTEQSAVILNNVHIDHANPAAESNRQFFKENESNRPKRINSCFEAAFYGVYKFA